jgi:hypothetical protein
LAKPVLTRSASLHQRIYAFGVLFGTLVTNFEPLTAFVMALTASFVLAKL